jgi:hypothetical protein
VFNPELLFQIRREHPRLHNLTGYNNAL